jgi:hypothetical protein
VAKTAKRCALFGCLAATAALLAGCANQRDIEPRPGPLKGLTPAEADARAAAVRHDPAAYLRSVAEKSRGLNQYTLRFTRHERLGILRQLHAPEHISCWFRRQPFSVRMKWLDEDTKYGEAVYVQGQADNKVRFVTRGWSPPLLAPPAINKVDLQAPVVWGESQQPLTDFGLERLMERTLGSYQRAGDQVVVSYEGLRVLPESERTVHHIHLEYPEAQHRVPIQELYVDTATDLPAGTILKLPSGQIDAAYFYVDVNPNVRLTDADFLLPGERGAAPAVKPARRARAAGAKGK